jgi:hypothetical protein
MRTRSGFVLDRWVTMAWCPAVAAGVAMFRLASVP